MLKKSRVRELLKDTRGLTMTEYVIIMCLVGIVGFAAWAKFGRAIRHRLTGQTSP